MSCLDTEGAAWMNIPCGCWVSWWSQCGGASLPCSGFLEGGVRREYEGS